MKKRQYDDSELVWACLKFIEGKHHINGSFIISVWNFLVKVGTITERQRECVKRFVKKHKIDVEKWSKAGEDDRN